MLEEMLAKLLNTLTKKPKKKKKKIIIIIIKKERFVKLQANNN